MFGNLGSVKSDTVLPTARHCCFFPETVISHCMFGNLGSVKSDTVLPTARHCCFFPETVISHCMFGNLGSVKSDTVLPTARHCCNISSKGAVLPERNDAETVAAKPLRTSASYSENNEKFDLIYLLRTMYLINLFRLMLFEIILN